MLMYVEVLVEIQNKHVDRTFTYQVPESLQEEIQIGKRVLVPFGKQMLEGYILNVLESTEVDAKDIFEVLDEEPVLNEEMLELGKSLKELTLSSLSSCYGAMLPKALKAKKKVQIKKKMESYLKLCMSFESAREEAQNDSQKKVIDLFQEEHLIFKKKANLVSASAVKTLLKNHVIEEIEEEVYRYTMKEVERKEKKVFTKEQEDAYEKMREGLGTSKVYLLHGVTGSGKTEIYLELIEDVIRSGKQALVLVPEISLTPQLVHRFSERFTRIAVLHSGLSDGERYDEWRKILKGEADIVIGARSAIFAPLTNIGIIIFDEEHSDSYKQENNPKYHALDIAKIRSETHTCPIVLGSATPTLDTMARAMKHVYEYVPLLQRANGKLMPTVTIVDMEEETKARHPILSRELECKMIEKLNKNEQVLLLLNRRGHSTTITCSNCGFTYRCPNCDIALTYHKSSNQLRCHYCGYTKFKSEVCPECHEEGLSYYGLGTEKLEDYLEEVFPRARVVRMDRDSTTKKGAYEQIIEDFGAHKYDILLGTQMISKGLDFEHVTLVGILNADQSLNIPDYRSNEKTFDLLCQASGRSGRSETPGEVIIQTFYPDHYILKCVQNHNYLDFYKYEMNIRKALKYPPFYYLVTILVKSKNYESASRESRKVKDYLTKHLEETSIILGPATASQFLLNKIYHFEITIKYKFDEHLKETLKELDEIYLTNKEVSLDIDFH